MCFRDPNVDDNGEETSSKWPIYKRQSRDYKELNADVIFSPESMKTGSLRAHQCGMVDWYLPKVEGKSSDFDLTQPLSTYNDQYYVWYNPVMLNHMSQSIKLCQR